jgi:hypothetical protein
MSLTDVLYFLLTLLVIFAFFAVIWVIGGYLLARSVDRDYRACPNCKRKAAGTITDTEVEILSTQIDRSKLTPMRVTREKVTDQYKCEYCGHTWEKTFEREDSKPLKGSPNP